MTPCEVKGYTVGEIFEVMNDSSFRKGSIVVLSEDDGSNNPKFDLIKGQCDYRSGIKMEYGAYISLFNVKRLYPPEEKSSKVTITCEGKSVEISRESAIALNLIKE